MWFTHGPQFLGAKEDHRVTETRRVCHKRDVMRDVTLLSKTTNKTNVGPTRPFWSLHSISDQVFLLPIRQGLPCVGRGTHCARNNVLGTTVGESPIPVSLVPHSTKCAFSVPMSPNGIDVPHKILVRSVVGRKCLPCPCRGSLSPLTGLCLPYFVLDSAMR